MSRVAKAFFWLLSVVAVLGLVNWAQNLIARDPLAHYARQALDNVAIRLTGVTLSHYKKGKLTGSAEIGEVDVRQDHQYFDFMGISRATFKTAKGNVNFSTDRASLDAITNQVNVPTFSHVSTKNLSVVAPAFLYDQPNETLTMPGKVTGTLYGGKLVASNLSYHGKTDSYKIASAEWTGALPKSAGIEAIPGQDTGRHNWHISGSVDAANNIINYTNARADDGEILITAPTAQLDQKTDVLTASGPPGSVHYYSEKANLVCDKAVIYRKEKRAVLTGNVHMLVKPKDEQKLDVSEIPPFNPPVPAKVAASRPAAPQTEESQQEKDLDEDLRSSKTTRKYPAHIHADQIEYWYGKGNRHAVITGSPDCYQEFPEGRWRRVVTYKALYDGEKDEMTLISTDGKKDTRMVDSLGDDMVATQFIVSTKEDDERYKGQAVEGVYAAEETDETKALKNGGEKGTDSSGSAPSKGAPVTTPGTKPGTPNPNTGPAPTPNTPASNPPQTGH